VDRDAIFRALADPSRRLLLDRLFERDGQSITPRGTGLCLSRFGVAKHLEVLNAAGLVTIRRVGRERLNYLNPVPIQQVYDRWVSKYATPWARTLTGLKAHLEEAPMKPTHAYHVFIRTTPERLWSALTEGDLTEQYFGGGRVESDWRVGSPYAFINEEGKPDIAGEVLEYDPPRRLVQTFRFPQMDDAPSRVTWEIEPMGETCRLTLLHEFESEGATFGEVGDPNGGWHLVLSGLKTVLETDRPLVLTRG
jgi:uncharacterized protein YndB with AHSA1/START domain/DNA-binding transcriptional ArsR family regulator